MIYKNLLFILFIDNHSYTPLYPLPFVLHPLPPPKTPPHTLLTNSPGRLSELIWNIQKSNQALTNRACWTLLTFCIAWAFCRLTLRILLTNSPRVQQRVQWIITITRSALAAVWLGGVKTYGIGVTCVGSQGTFVLFFFGYF